MGGWGVFLGLRIFFLKIFHPKIKSVQNGLKCKKNTNFFSLLNNYSLRPVRKATARAWSIWIISAQAVHFPARADTPRTGPALRHSFFLTLKRVSGKHRYRTAIAPKKV